MRWALRMGISQSAWTISTRLGRLKDHGIEPEREPYRVHEGGSRICFVRDPDG
jgi:lactoylglutathione lyase